MTRASVIAGILVVVGGLFVFMSESRQNTFASFDGVELCFFDNQEVGRPVILLHGLMVDSKTNFGLNAYSDTGRRVILLDARGHGCSQKPHDLSAYADRAMARDVLALIDHLDLTSIEWLGQLLL